ncbi:TadE/TadG family type IV pilus assembly protein [Sporomusa sp.]|uniref:TadE/TadG family type IV pilus assembly protein n=1 Tax=Sporomusa sp. TaxID=2078658 RepID=UPI002C7F5B0C|nr:TadE/TadG family type IV pilus assembly protein [Sporomusa sp.]HWR08544.1 TadE/TadG family type IV pilus assembly protein [Sporomusa sp.]
MNITRYLKCNRGQTKVQTAIVLPVLVLILFSLLEFGQVMNQYLILTAAAREGARLAAVSNDTAARAAVNGAVASIGNNDLLVNIGYSNGKREQGMLVTVTVCKPITVITPIFKDIINQAFTPDPLTLKGQSVMRVEVP